MAKRYPKQARLHELFEDVGDTLRRRVSVKGALAGTEIRKPSPHGYYCVSVDGEAHYVHRLLWIMRHGRVPGHLDHADGNRRNNLPTNLREVTPSQNAMNRALPARGGVYPVRGYPGKYAVQVMARGTSHYAGVFDNHDSACAAAEALRAKLHGEYRRGGVPSAAH